jgi:hypothetical protein
VDALVVREIGERLPLRSGQSETLRALFESFAKQTGDVVKEKTESWIGVHETCVGYL